MPSVFTVQCSTLPAVTLCLSKQLLSRSAGVETSLGKGEPSPVSPWLYWVEFSRTEGPCPSVHGDVGGINGIMEEKRRECRWLTPALAGAKQDTRAAAPAPRGARRAGGEQGIVFSHENLGGAAQFWCGGERMTQVGALGLFRHSDHGCASVLQDPGLVHRCLVVQGLQRGCWEHLLGLMQGDGSGPRLSRMSNDFWCPAGDCCQGNWLGRHLYFPELPITFWKWFPLGFMSCFQQKGRKGVQNPACRFVPWMPPSTARSHCLFFPLQLWEVPVQSRCHGLEV